ncbi:hypothetical protein PENSPDRAFT_456720 [Peniophora sp. CONT]|nr:hypothetical protein PENSPDRAFT_456720 [Peniophora sp. CONT]
MPAYFKNSIKQLRRFVAPLAPRTLRASAQGRRVKPVEVASVFTTVPQERPALKAARNVSTETSPTSTKPSGRVRLRHLFHLAVVKDSLLLSLTALAESSDSFPPLKSAVGGLLFLVTQVELVAGNKAQVEELYAQIDSFAASLERAIPDVTVLSPTAKSAIRALAEDVQAVCVDMEAIASQRPILRFLRAKRHSGDLQDLIRRLDQANTSFTCTMLTSTETKCTQILSCVEPIQGMQEDVRRLSRWARLSFFFCSRASELECSVVALDWMTSLIPFRFPTSFFLYSP